MIEPFQEYHVPAVASLHARYLTGLLHDLGPGAIKAFYQGAVNSSSAIGFVYSIDGAITGFVFGSRDPVGLKRDITAGNFWNTFSETCAGLIRKPSLVRSLFDSIRPRLDAYDSREAELTYLAVDGRVRAIGVGRQLVEQFSRAVFETGIHSYELSVDADNHPAICFYQRLGFTEKSRYREFGTDHIRFRMEMN